MSVGVHRPTQRRSLRFSAFSAMIVSAIILVAACLMDARRASASWLFAYAVLFTLCAGAIVFSAIVSLAGAEWSRPFESLVRSMAASAPLVVLSFVPLAVTAPRLYPWAHGEVAEERSSPLWYYAHEALERKQAWLNLPGFYLRSFVYLVTLLVLGELTYRVRSDSERANHAAAASLLVGGVVFSFAGFDWVMSLQPEWYANSFGVYLLSGGFASACAAACVLAGFWPALLGTRFLRAGHAERATTHALGTLLFAGVCFWAYIAFTQFLIIWLADIPELAVWYIRRGHSLWKWLALALVVGHFAIPFVLLLYRDLKSNPRALACVAGLVFVMHVVDIYWLVMPALGEHSFAGWWADLASLAVALVLTAALFSFRRRRFWAADIGPDVAASEAERHAFEMEAQHV